MGLLSRGSRVRVAAGAPFPKEFADFSIEKIIRRTQIDKSDRSREFAPELADFAIIECRRNSDVLAAGSIDVISKTHPDLRP